MVYHIFESLNLEMLRPTLTGSDWSRQPCVFVLKMILQFYNILFIPDKEEDNHPFL